jgi:putative SOS response-associated peptidase YedK
MAGLPAAGEHREPPTPGGGLILAVAERRRMCGRTSLFVPKSELEDRFEATVVADGGYRPRYNIAPGSGLAVVTNDAPDEIDRFHWGLVPPWAEAVDDGYINARAETAAETRPFGDAWANRPCLVLSSGFYEWRDVGAGPKEPHRVHREDDPAFAMAGLWQETTVDDEPVRSVTILTTEPCDVVEPIHDRMPVVLCRDEESAWLERGPAERQALCRPYPGDDLDAYPVGRTVNDPGNDDPRVIEPAETEQRGLGDFGG